METIIKKTHITKSVLIAEGFSLIDHDGIIQYWTNGQFLLKLYPLLNCVSVFRDNTESNQTFVKRVLSLDELKEAMSEPK